MPFPRAKMASSFRKPDGLTVGSPRGPRAPLPRDRERARPQRSRLCTPDAEPELGAHAEHRRELATELLLHLRAAADTVAHRLRHRGPLALVDHPGPFRLVGLAALEPLPAATDGQLGLLPVENRDRCRETTLDALEVGLAPRSFSAAGKDTAIAASAQPRTSIFWRRKRIKGRRGDSRRRRPRGFRAPPNARRHGRVSVRAPAARRAWLPRRRAAVDRRPAR